MVQMWGKIQRRALSVVRSSSNNSTIGLSLSLGALAIRAFNPQQTSLEIPETNRKVLTPLEVPGIGM